jgi:hypothetical protein
LLRPFQYGIMHIESCYSPKSEEIEALHERTFERRVTNVGLDRATNLGVTFETHREFGHLDNDTSSRPQGTERGCLQVCCNGR